MRTAKDRIEARMVNWQVRGRRRAEDYTLLLFARLAVAAKHDVPFTSALEALQHDAVLNRHNLRAARWRERVALIAGDLGEGQPLSRVLDRHVGEFLPAHIVPALHEAERNQTLDNVLPWLAANLEDSVKARQRLRDLLLYPLFQAAIMFTILSGTFTFILPKFNKIFDEMLPGEPAPLLLRLIVHYDVQKFITFLTLCFGIIFTSWLLLRTARIFVALLSRIVRIPPKLERRFGFTRMLVFFTILALLIALLGPASVEALVLAPFTAALALAVFYLAFISNAPEVSVSKRRSLLPRLFGTLHEYFHMRLPILCGIRRRRNLLELANALAGMLTAGLDLPAAVRYGAESAESSWVRGRLRQWLTRIESGANWAAAWEELKIAPPLVDWIIRNAAARENPAEGFQMVAEYIADDVARYRHRVAAWLEPVMILCNSVVGAFVVYAVMQTLFRIIDMPI